MGICTGLTWPDEEIGTVRKLLFSQIWETEMNLSYPEINLLEAIEKCHEEVAEDGPRSYSGLDDVIDHLDDPPLEKDHSRYRQSAEKSEKQRLR